MSLDLGFIGLGNMGEPMARHLIKAGHRLVVCDRRADAGQELEALGARVVATPLEVANSAEIVFASLPSPAIVEAVVTGEAGVLEGKRIKCFVDLSTTGATTSIRIGSHLAQKNIAHLDAPVSGGKAGAIAGTLSVMVSGPRATFTLVEPLLGRLGKVSFIGEKPGVGQIMKLVNNLLSATALAATSEAVVMAVKAGIDPQIAVEVISSGSGRNSAAQDKFPNAIIPRTFDAGFTTGLMYKDLRLCMEEAEALGAQMWIGGAVRQYWQLVQNLIGPESDFTQFIEIPERWAGVQVGAKKS
jgi:3-hydroxyisobutyrate dehydrogenase-like beta-hydroxyacid dehydrogenase